MNLINYLAVGSIRDPDFIYVFIGQVILFVLVWLAGVYALYRIVIRMFPTLNKYIQLVTAFGVGIILVSLIGFVTEMIQS